MVEELSGFVVDASGTVYYQTALQNLSDRSAMRAFEIIKEHTSHNTHRAQKGDLIYWRAWLTAIGFSFDRHITEGEVIGFIVQHAVIHLNLS